MGKMSRDKGAAYERALANYLRPHFPRIDRAVRTGYRTVGRVSADPGDLTGTDWIVWSAKDTATAMRDQAAEYGYWMEEVRVMVAASPRAPRPIGLLVVKRHGCISAGRSWVHLRLDDLGRLVGAPVSSERTPIEHDVPVRAQLADLLPALVAWEQRWAT